MTQPNFKVKRGDLVQVMVGSYKGKRGIVTKVLLEDAKIFVEGVGNVKRHIRPSAQNPNGFIMKQRSIHISNVALVDQTTNSPGKVAYRVEDGKKIRFFKKTNVVLGNPSLKG